MTREEAIEFIAQSVKSDVDMAKVADAIEALEQETFINKPCENCKKDWTKCGTCPVMMQWVKEHKHE